MTTGITNRTEKLDVRMRSVCEWTPHRRSRSALCGKLTRWTRRRAQTQRCTPLMLAEGTPQLTRRRARRDVQWPLTGLHLCLTVGEYQRRLLLSSLCVLSALKSRLHLLDSITAFVSSSSIWRNGTTVVNISVRQRMAVTENSNESRSEHFRTKRPWTHREDQENSDDRKGWQHRPLGRPTNAILPSLLFFLPPLLLLLLPPVEVCRADASDSNQWTYLRAKRSESTWTDAMRRSQRNLLMAFFTFSSASFLGSSRYRRKLQANFATPSPSINPSTRYAAGYLKTRGRAPEGAIVGSCTVEQGWTLASMSASWRFPQRDRHDPSSWPMRFNDGLRKERNTFWTWHEGIQAGTHLDPERSIDTTHGTTFVNKLHMEPQCPTLYNVRRPFLSMKTAPVRLHETSALSTARNSSCSRCWALEGQPRCWAHDSETSWSNAGICAATIQHPG